MWETVKSWLSADTPTKNHSNQSKRSRLVLFIHGLGGSHASTFGRFAELLREDPAIATHYDVDAFDYSSGFTAFGAAPAINDVARYLATTIDNRYGSYTEIVIIAHSMGGLVTRRYIADRLQAGRPSRADVQKKPRTPASRSARTWPRDGRRGAPCSLKSICTG